MSKSSISQTGLEYDQVNQQIMFYGRTLEADALIRMINKHDAATERTIAKLNRRIRSQHEELTRTKSALSRTLDRERKLKDRIKSIPSQAAQERNEYVKPDHMHDWQIRNAGNEYPALYPFEREWYCTRCDAVRQARS
jgi:septal ring factor EnvC (AmiA/AmiB activator)